MATNSTATKRVSKSDAIRDILKQRPKATANEIHFSLQEHGVKASDALISSNSGRA